MSASADLQVGDIVVYSAGPARLAIVMAIRGAIAQLCTLDTRRVIWRPVAALWAIL